MNKIGAAIVLFFISLFVYTKLAGPIPFTVNSVTTTKTDTFSVTGEGKVSISPDIALVSAGVQTQAPTVKQAQENLNKAINAVIAAVKSAGVDSKDIKTQNYSVSPQYDWSKGTQRITGYQASSNVEIKVRNLDKVNAVIDAATTNGANQVGGITFDVDDRTKAENEARKQAVAEAKRKAKMAADVGGFKLGALVNYQESFGGGPRPYPMMMAKEGIAADSAPTQVEPGTTEVTLTVTLSYSLQ